MKELITYLFISSFLIGFALEMADIAEKTRVKVIDFAEKMNVAIDCAFEGVPIETCNVSFSNFKEDAKIFKENLGVIMNDSFTTEK